MSHFITVSPELFQSLGENLLAKSLGSPPDSRRFRSFFGVSPLVCAAIWHKLGRRSPRSAKPEYLLWALKFLKIYATEHVHCSVAGCDDNFFRKWSWNFVLLMADLQVVSNYCVSLFLFGA